jgi:hypothetical protein
VWRTKVWIEDAFRRNLAGVLDYLQSYQCREDVLESMVPKKLYYIGRACECIGSANDQSTPSFEESL